MDDLTVLFLAVGGILTAVGLVLTILGFVLRRWRVVASLSERAALTGTSAAAGTPFLGVVVPLHYEMTELIVHFREVHGNELRVDIRDLIADHGGSHRVMNYDAATGSEGSVGTTLSPGSYDVHFVATDLGPREVEYKVSARSFTYPLRRYVEVSLTMLTVGVVFLVEGLVNL